MESESDLCDETDQELTFHKNSHIAYFKAVLVCLPEHYSGLDTSRMSAIYFSIVALDMLGALESVDRNQVIEYIYSLQITAINRRPADHHFGFTGSPYLPLTCLPCNDSSSVKTSANECEGLFCNSSASSLDRHVMGHIAMTYTALAALLTLGDSFERVEKAQIVAGLKLLQDDSGSFRGTCADSESDMRFLYCACAISAMLGDWSGVDKERAVGYVLRCLTYEGGVALLPGSEAQGGTSFCALASLSLMGRMDALSDAQRADLLGWCERRQSQCGYEGRTGKEPDSCYSFWQAPPSRCWAPFTSRTHPPTEHSC